MKRTLIAFLIIYSLVTIQIYGQEEYKRFLIPIQPQVTPGAFGSIWHATLAVVYSGTETAFVVPRITCPPITCPWGENVEPNQTPRSFAPTGLASTGLLLYVTRGQAGGFAFAARVRDESRSFASAGTEIPVVPETEIRNAPVHLLNVPVDARFRTLLRVYALPLPEAHTVTVRYLRMNDDVDTAPTPIRTEQLILPPVDDSAEFLVQPMYVQRLLDDLGEIGDAAWITVTPDDPTVQIWAFTSTTNNETQEITVVTPQRE